MHNHFYVTRMKPIILCILSTFILGYCYHHPDDCIYEFTLVNNSDQEVYVAGKLYCNDETLQTLYPIKKLQPHETGIYEIAWGKCFIDEDPFFPDGMLYFVPSEYYLKPGTERCFPPDSLIARYRVAKAIKLTKPCWILQAV